VQIDGATETTSARVAEFNKVLSAESPALIFAHWPIDTHMDHQVASQLAYRAYLSLGGRARLYFFEVNTGIQSQGFTPNLYVDISTVLEKKSCFVRTQKPGRRRHLARPPRGDCDVERPRDGRERIGGVRPVASRSQE